MTAVLRNNRSVPVNGIPLLAEGAFTDGLAALLESGHRVCSYFGDRDGGDVTLYAVCADDASGELHVLKGNAGTDRFQSLTPRFPQVHMFEREIHEQTGLVPEGHPWLKPVRFPNAPGGTSGSQIGLTDFFRMQGDEVHQVAVGPVHAGIIEPGHFRFQCHGEIVHHLEISLGYQHRGIEAGLRGGPHPVTPFHMEAAAGDTTIGHMTAYANIMETLQGRKASQQAGMVRAIALELERCANHTGDLGALAGDIGFQPTMAYCGRIRGEFLNMTALLCGNRFGRGLVVPGGTGYGLTRENADKLAVWLRQILADFLNATGLLWDSYTVLERFEGTGTVTHQVAAEMGLVGPAARASGYGCDIRQDHPYGYYRFAHIPVAGADTGDVFARAHVRWQEVQHSVEFILQQLSGMAGTERLGGPGDGADGALAADTLTVSLVEGWRGEICHTAVTGTDGTFKRYKIVDPSFHNWFGLAWSLRDQQISDFPLCNKSFNLSYCGFDL